MEYVRWCIQIDAGLLTFLCAFPTFFEVNEALEGPQKKVAKKLESGMRSFSPILRRDPFGYFYLSVSRLTSAGSAQAVRFT